MICLRLLENFMNLKKSYIKVTYPESYPNYEL